MQMKKLCPIFLIPLLAFAINLVTAVSAHAQPIYNVLTQADLSSPCRPQQGDNSNNTYGCCGSPGLRECGADLHYTKWFSTGCTDPDSNVYHADTQDCNLGSPSLIANPISPDAPLGGRDFTFYVTSDSHPWRGTFNVAGQLNQVTAINGFAAQQIRWSLADRSGPFATLCESPCTGLPSTPISAPLGIWFAGDMTTNAAPNALGAFRLLWEKGLLAGGINYPVYVGMGNHDLYTEVSSQDSAMAMWNYIRDRMGAMNMDLSSTGALGVDDGNGSHDYSRDWQGVHIVQLNTAPGDDTNSTMYTKLKQNSLAWLRNNLANATANDPHKPIIIIHHYPNNSGSGDQAEYDVLKKYNVIGIFVGHTHVVSTQQVSDPRAVTDPARSTATFDEFNDGAGGYCANDVDQCDESGSVGEFIPVRVTDNYMDVAVAGWSWDASAGAPGAPGLLDKDTNGNSMMAGGYAGCRKRINTTYNDITYAFSGLPSVQSNYLSIQVTSPNYVIHGPVVAKLVGTTNSARHDFVDACVNAAGGNPYIILNGGKDIPAHTVLTIAPFINAGISFSSSWNAEIFRMVPLQSAATPGIVTFTTQNGQVYAGQVPPLSQDIGTRNVVLNGPRNDVLTFSITYEKSDDGTTPFGWIGLQTSSGCSALSTATLDATGYASVPICFLISPSLFSMTAGVANALVTVHGTSGQIYSFSVSLTLRASVSVSLSAVAGSNPPQFNAKIAYLPLDPTSPDGAKIPLGQIQLQQVTLGLGGTQQGAATVLSTQAVNDVFSDCPSPVKDQATFGAPGDGTQQHCGASSQGASPSGSAFTFPTTKGLYYLQASYVGEGASPSPGPWFYPDLSPVLPLLIGSKTIGTIAKGNNQSTPVGQVFTTPIDVSIGTEQNDWSPADLLVTFTLPSSGPSGTFADGTKQAILPVFSDAKIAGIVANSIPGKWTMTVTIDGGAAPLFLEMTNLPAGENPVMSASRSSTQGTLTQRIWNLNVASAGPASVATPQIDSIVVAPIMPKTSSTGIFCTAPTLVTRLPIKLPAPFSASGGSQTAHVAMSFGQCDPKALYNVTITLSDGAGHTSGSYLKAVTP